jgi:putative membrane protein
MSLNDLINYKYIIASFWIIEKVTPENIWKGIVEKNNIALALVCAAFIIAVAIIISSAIHG